MPVDETLARGLEFLKAHKIWAGPILGLLAGFESLAVIGAFAPLTASLVIVGAAIGSGLFEPLVLAWIMLGCAVGNGLSYETGAFARRRGLAATWIPARARAVADTLFRRYGVLSVPVARFLGPPSSVTPFLAGWAALPRGPFWLANLATCVIWPLCVAAFGFFGWKTFKA
jgi:membrane protein DedA with SNARE-associated domain